MIARNAESIKIRRVFSLCTEDSTLTLCAYGNRPVDCASMQSYEYGQQGAGDKTADIASVGGFG